MLGSLLRPRHLAAGSLSTMLLGASSSLGAAPAQPLPSITVMSNAATQALPLFYARAHGLFRKAGLNVRFTLASTGSVVELAVIGGAVDIGFTNSMTLTNAVGKGIRLEAVAGADEYNSAAPDVRILTLPNSPIASAADLDGKTIGVPGLHDEATISTMAWVDRHGGDSKTLRFIEIPPTVMDAALRAQRVSAVTIYDPYAVQMASEGLRTIGYPLDAIAPHFLTTEWIAMAPWVSTHRSEAVRFEQVMSDASAYCTAHFAELLPVVADYSKLPVASLRQSAPETYAGSVQPAQLQPIVDVAAKYGHIKPFVASREIFQASSRTISAVGPS